MISRAAIINPRGEADALVVHTDANDASTFDPAWVLSSAPTGSRVFNGTTDRIDWAAVANLTGSAITISAWVNLSSLPVGSSKYALHIHNSTDAGLGIMFYANTDGTFSFYRAGATALFRQSSSNMGTGAWVHILATHTGTFTDRTTITLYKNGVDDTMTGSGSNGATETSATGSWSVGGRIYDDARNFPGSIAQVGVWNRVLTANEISILAAGAKPEAISSGLQFYLAADTSSLVAVPGGTGTADGTTWSASGPTLAGVTMAANYGDGAYATGATGVTKTYAAGKGRHRVRLTTPDWNRVTSLNLYSDVGVLQFPPLSRLRKLALLYFDSNSFTGPHPHVNDCPALTQIHTEYVPFTGAFPTLERCTGLTTILIHGAYGLNGGGLYGQLPSLASLTSLVAFDCSSNRLTGPLPSFAACTAMTLFECGTNLFTGTLPSFNACTLLQTFSVGVNLFDGTIPTMAACTALTIVQLNYCGFTGYTAGCFATQKDLATLQMEGNALPAAAVNAVLADLVASLGGGRVGCTVTLNAGTNAAPTGQGITDKTTLNGTAGWTVTTT